LGFEKNTRMYKVRKIGRLPRALTESSALEVAHDGTFWTLQDSGGGPYLYLFDQSGKILDTLEISDGMNRDWEELGQDNNGHLFIGDLGNNLNKRRDLKVYKLDLPTGVIQVLDVTYQDQTHFPPERTEMNFDCEAYFWMGGNIHLFSKNRGLKSVRHYELPDQPGSYSLKPKDELILKGKVTAADISPDGKLMALLSYGKVWLFNIQDVDNLWANPYKCVKVNRGQTEGVVFINNTDLIISNETGKLFLVSQNAGRE